MFHGHSQKAAAYVAFEVFRLVVDQTEEFKAEFDRSWREFGLPLLVTFNESIRVVGNQTQIVGEYVSNGVREECFHDITSHLFYRRSKVFGLKHPHKVRNSCE